MASLLGFLSKAVDQINPFDNNRTWKQRTPTNNLSVRQQNQQALKTTGTGIGLRGVRSGVGFAQGASGLFDLVSPGRGTNRFSKGLDNYAKFVDQTAKTGGFNTSYQASAVPIELLLAKGLASGANLALRHGPKAVFDGAKTYNSGVNKVADFIAKDAGRIGKATSYGVRTGLKPSVLASDVAFNAKYTGEDASKGVKITPARVASDAGLSLLTNVGGQLMLKGAGKGVATAADVATPERARATASRSEQIIRATQRKLGPEQNPVLVGQYRNTIAQATKAKRRAEAAIKYHDKGFGLSTKKVEDPLETLKAEARKYKSAEEFVNSRKPYYHSTESDIANTIEQGGYKTGFGKRSQASKGSMEKGVFLYPDDVEAADYFGKNLRNPKTLSNRIDGKIYDAETSSKYGWEDDLQTQEIASDPKIIEQLRKDGYVGVTSTELGTPATFVFDEKAIKTDKQLTDLYNRARPTATPSRIAPPTTKANPPIKPPININRYDLDKAQKKTLEKTVKQITPELEKVKGGVLKNKDVIKAAQTSDLLRKVTTKKQTQEAAAALLRTRQNVASLDAEITRLGKTGDTTVVKAKMADMIEGLRVVKSHQADAARKLQSGVIGAGEVSGRAEVLSKIAKVEQDTDKIVKAAASVDWDNAEAVTKFYRSFIKPSMGDILKEYRYNNMLSSPKTQVRNAFSNIVQTFVTRPTTIALSGHPLKAFQYEKGAVKAIPEAFRDFAKSWSGKKAITQPDLKYISTGKLPKFATIPTRAMEASDMWFQKVISSGELATGASAKQAQNMAEYSIFRGGLHPKGQGKLLNRVDDAIGAIDHIRDKVPGMGWAVPFIRTPMNFAKQWIEYNPLTGPLTMIGAKNKKEQLAKTIIGSVATAYGANLAMEGRTTWGAPTDAKEKELFYASGKKPYSVKIGDKWVPMIYLGPATLAAALPAAAKYYQDESKTALTDGQLEKLGRTVAGMGQLWSQQTFVQGIGSFVNMVSGDVDFNLARNAAGFARQVVPATGLLNYVASVMDPIYRRPSGFTENIKTGIPQLSKSVKPYTDPNGNPSTRLPVNKFLPYDIGQEKPEFLDALQARTKKLQSNNVISKANQTGETSFKQLPDGRFTAKVGDEYKAFDSEADAQKAVEKDAFDKSGKSIQTVGDTVFRRSDSGYIITQTKTAYEYQLGTAQLTKFKKNGDVAGWMKTAEKQLERIEQQLKDPHTDPLEAARLENQAQYLLESAAKYQSYGGFTKGRSGRSSASLPSGVSSALKTTGIVSAPKVPNIRITKPTYKKASLRKLAVSKLPKVVG